jgi:hypothetical protein
MKNRMSKYRSNTKNALIGAFALLFVLISVPDTSYACGSCACVQRQHNSTRQTIEQQHIITREHITAEFQYMQLWITNDFFLNWVLPAWMMLTEQLSAVGMQQMQILGSFLDAQQQLAAVDLCYIGTTARSLSASERLGELNSVIMTQRSQDRQFGNYDSAAATGRREDREGRLEQYIRNYCDIDDNRGMLAALCLNGGAPPAQVNKDVNYTRFIDQARTLNVNFTDNVLTMDEQTVLAMQSYLFGHDVFNRPAYAEFTTKDGTNDLMDMRAVVAKRSVAENSFGAIIGLKSRGGPNSATTFLPALLVDMGVPPAEASYIVGLDAANNPIPPSYFAQLEWMARKIYEREEFFTSLYDKPANVKRKNVAMQAVDLMIDRDSYRSDIRSEALLSVLLEMELMKLQEDVQNRINLLDNQLSR